MLEMLSRNGLALAALFVALGGTAFAVGTITGADVRNNSLSGRDVNESKLAVTRLAAQPTGTADVIAPVPPPSSPPPQPPSDFGVIYPVSPSEFTLKRAALVEVIGRMSARLIPGSPCTDGFASAFVFIDGKHIAHNVIDVSPTLPLAGAPVPAFKPFAPLRVGRGTHEVEVRVSSLCEAPAPGVAAEVTAVRLGVVANQF